MESSPAAAEPNEPRASKAAPRRQAITKADREFAALVSRLLAPQPSTQRATSCLLPVLQLFRGVWGLLPPGAMGERGGGKGAAGGGTGSGPLDDPLGEAWGSLLHQRASSCKTKLRRSTEGPCAEWPTASVGSSRADVTTPPATAILALGFGPVSLALTACSEQAGSEEVLVTLFVAL
ncbi:hypothetical protein HaLaN_26327, partial [Haematococcus lacustris]